MSSVRNRSKRATSARSVRVREPQPVLDAQESIEIPDEERQRRERKRFTDRVAQREHRKRQRKRVEQLQSQLNLVKSGDAGQTVQSLLEENDRLRSEVTRLRECISTIKDAISVCNENEYAKEKPLPAQGQAASANIQLQDSTSYAESNGRICQDTEDPVVALSQDSVSPPECINRDQDFAFQERLSNRQNDPICQSSSNVLSESLLIADSCTSNAYSNLFTHSNNTKAQHGVASLYLSEQSGTTPLSEWLAAADFLHDESGSAKPAEDIYNSLCIRPDVYFPYSAGNALYTDSSFSYGVDGWRSPSSNIAGQVWPFSRMETSNPMMRLAGNTRPSHLPQISANLSAFLDEISSPGRNLVFDDQLLNTDMHLPPSSVIGPAEEISESLMHRALPNHLLPPLKGDTPIHQIIERARTNFTFGRVVFALPTLNEFLFNNPSNVLAAGLKALMASYHKPEITPEFLASYWIIYLLLRWEVSQTIESYQKIPPWFRPTKMQRNVQHPLCIDCVAWPTLRDELIILHMTIPSQVATVVNDIGKYLDVDLTGSCSGNKSRADEMLHEKICDLRAWKLKPGFFDLYPSMSGLCEKAVATYYL